MSADRNRVLIAAEDYQFLDTVTGSATKALEWRVAGSLEAITAQLDPAPYAVILDLEASSFHPAEVLSEMAARGVDSRIVLLVGDDLRKLNSAKRAAAALSLQIAGTLSRPLTMMALSRLLHRHTQDAAAVPITAEELARGIAHHELLLHYQPIYWRVGDEWVVRGAEALVRWDHPKLGLLYPGQFLRIADGAGMLGDVTDFVLAEALRQAGNWESRHLDIGVSINLSPGLVQDRAFVERFTRIMDEHGVSPSRVTLDLIETASMRDRAMVHDVLTRLRLKGVSLSLDDFGTGYSSLTELCRLPFSEIKIDRTLIHDVPEHRQAATIVQAIVDLGSRLAMRVCAEGVETEAARAFLVSAGCSAMQGVLFAPSLPAADVEALATGAARDFGAFATVANA